MQNYRSEDLLKEFAKYCQEHPEERFWQALRNWSGKPFILVAELSNLPQEIWNNDSIEDTFYWEKKNE